MLSNTLAQCTSPQNILVKEAFLQACIYLNSLQVPLGSSINKLVVSVDGVQNPEITITAPSEIAVVAEPILHDPMRTIVRQVLSNSQGGRKSMRTFPKRILLVSQVDSSTLI